MSTLDNTISMLEALPETDLLEVQKFTRQLFQRHKTETPDDAIGRFLKPMSQEDLFFELYVIGIYHDLQDYENTILQN